MRFIICIDLDAKGIDSDQIPIDIGPTLKCIGEKINA